MKNLILTAIKFMLFDKAKSIGALSGIVISIFLIGQQTGIFIFLTNAMASIVNNNSQYIWVVDETTTNANALAQLDMRIGRELESVYGVKKAYPLVMAIGGAKFPNGKSSSITLIGTQYPAFAGGPWNISTGKATDMLPEGAIFTDYFDKKTLGGAQWGDYFEINNNKVYIAGQTKGVRGFGGPVYTFTTIERARFLAKLPNNRASAFLIEWDPAIGRDSVVSYINKQIYGVKAWKSDEFAYQTILTVLKSSGIAISFGTLIVFALISGFIIIGLTLYSAAIDRIKDYGTLKAIGAKNTYINKLILTQATIFAFIGFIIATLLIEGFRAGIANAGTLFNYPLWMRFAFFGLTLLISIGGSFFAIRRIAKLEPAEVFR
jgi:putative ABC transport system permease protein